MNIKAIPFDPKLPQYTDKCRCMVCGLYFNSAYAFAEHKVGKVGTRERRCMNTVEMRTAGWAESESGHWVTRPRPAVNSPSDDLSQG